MANPTGKNKGGAPIGNLNRIKNKPRFITIQLVKHLLEEVQDERDVSQSTPAHKRATRRRVDFLVDTLVKLALNGDTTAIKMVMDRVEGLAIQTMNFKISDIEDGKETPEQLAALEKTRGALEKMPLAELHALYHTTLNPASATRGSA